MKKLTSLALIVTLGLSGAAIAAPAPQGGFGGPVTQSGFTGATSTVTIAQAKDLPDDSWVTLRGNITQRLTKDNYVFKDSTGEIQVEIDRDEWRGQTVTPTDLVEITGEVDKDWNSVEIDVKQIRVVNQ
ncbi:YgiW/YdeI family stress tolerance OB fold protein [Orbus mooreae]|uniref:YgiW/YdeI family stress tolerance OB fold protein n=1 Tax=Orbus mooreae TaxID=3074107 RepID=UPI00370DC4F5